MDRVEQVRQMVDKILNQQYHLYNPAYKLQANDKPRIAAALAELGV